MSRGQTPRTPEYFPRMNDRAGRRRHRRAVKAITNPTFADKMRQVAAAFNTLTDQIAKAFRPVVEQFAQMHRTLFSPGKVAERIGRKMWAEQQAHHDSPVAIRTGPEPAVDLADLPRPPKPEPMAIMVSIEEQQHQADMRARSYRLAIERGHMRSN